jgi:hypothetical protein
MIKFTLKINRHKSSFSFGNPIFINRDCIIFNGERYNYGDFNIRSDNNKIIVFINGVDGQIATGSASYDAFILWAIGSGVPYDQVVLAYQRVKNIHRTYLFSCAGIVIFFGLLIGLFGKWHFAMPMAIGVIAVTYWHNKIIKNLF